MKPPGAPAARACRPEPIDLVLLDFGLFTEITPLNPRFVAGRGRLKLTLDVRLPPPDESRAPDDLLGALLMPVPGLARHRCCGGKGIRRAFSPGPNRSERGPTEADATADVAHLLEHVVIDFLRHVADMDVCSGVTCGYESPRCRYDVFIESPSRVIGRLCAHLALGLMNEVLRGGPPDPRYADAVGLAGALRRNPVATVSEATAARLLHGGARARAALRLLADTGYLREVETCINFSRVPVFALDEEESAGAARAGRADAALDLDPMRVI